jgi:hypothetical protein
MPHARRIRRTVPHRNLLPLGALHRGMPRFFFHIRDRDGLTEDPEGTELPDLDAARTDALAAARDILAERIAKDGRTGDPRFEIRDEAGRLLATVPFRDAMEPP